MHDDKVNTLQLTGNYFYIIYFIQCVVFGFLSTTITSAEFLVKIVNNI